MARTLQTTVGELKKMLEGVSQQHKDYLASWGQPNNGLQQPTNNGCKP